ncbi:hypothetical protein [Phascolarctobacterium faecium]|uniref:hypothetical protein n=1 Tax=Phascolarctobacterium faecium TaxID=33025 RepID=UPI003AB117F2
MKKIIASLVLIVFCVGSYLYVYTPYKEQREIKNQLKNIYHSLAEINHDATSGIGGTSDNNELGEFAGRLYTAKNKLLTLRGKIKNKENLEIYNNLLKSISKHYEWIEAQRTTNEKYNKNQESIREILSLGVYELTFGNSKSLMNEVDMLRKENDKIFDKSSDLYWSLSDDESLIIAESYFK